MWAKIYSDVLPYLFIALVASVRSGACLKLARSACQCAGIIAAIAMHDEAAASGNRSKRSRPGIAGMRKAYRQAMLRWHPDKMAAR